MNPILILEISNNYFKCHLLPKASRCFFNIALIVTVTLNEASMRNQSDFVWHFTVCWYLSASYLLILLRQKSYIIFFITPFWHLKNDRPKAECRNDKAESVGPTGRSDWSVRPRLRPTGRSDQSDRPVGQTVAEPPTSVNQINVAC